ncbi:retropepsin-like aspartic protease [Alteromonas sp. 1_MG-2023]|uniref:retropepsin-like aspartic protease family protein n=1 Tax=Alteromonas sp. 1_MG-2023 TaxID=3062669 RepID=UPI0026E288D8|nr:retropepsin-like aspartic protease [Alteromonas sp. 1_MG-2023]MDO6568712.1 retropepsin-like aspartic protease [Alteromonas sp. 1_MG-2023]
MNKGLLACLFVVLAASLLLNGYLFLSLNQAVEIAAANKASMLQSSASLDGHHERSAAHRNNAVAGSERQIDRMGQSSQTLQHELQITEQYIHELTLLLTSGNYALLKQQLNNALQHYPTNENLLLLEAELIVRTQPLSDALIHFHDLAELPLSPTSKAKVDKRITNLYNTAQEELTANSQWDLLANLNEPLFQRVPDNRQYTLQLAKAYAWQQKITLMEDVLASLAYNDRAANAVRNIAYNERSRDEGIINEASTDNMLGNTLLGNDVTRVALMREGDQYRVGVRALTQDAEMVLDTGATTTAITTGLFNQLGGLKKLTFIGNFDVNTASGTISAPLVHIPTFYFAGYRFNDVSALVLPAEALPNSDGLLGMNILGKFDFSISPQDSELTLKVREGN